MHERSTCSIKRLSFAGISCSGMKTHAARKAASTSFAARHASHTVRWAMERPAGGCGGAAEEPEVETSGGVVPMAASAGLG